MPSTRLSAESTPGNMESQQRSGSARSDVHAARGPELGTKRGSNGWRTLVNYISGGQGGRGGNGLQGHGGAGGAGEGPTLHYDLKAENIVVKTFNGLDATPSDFLRIPLGNLDLRSEILLDAAAGAVWRHHEQKRASVRRMYSARVVGHTEPMTVALYQGDNAEEEWKRDLARHSGLRHPHIVQIYASACSFGIHATIFHDDLVPFRQFLASFQTSAILRAYILWYTNKDWMDAFNHCTGLISSMNLVLLHHCIVAIFAETEHQSYTRWIRRSTGRLCVEFGNFITDDGFVAGPIVQSPPQSMLNLHDPNQESMIIASLGYFEWYSLCALYLSQCGLIDVSARADVSLGSIICWPSGSRFEHAIEIASATEVQNDWSGWYGATAQWREDEGAARYNSKDVFGCELYLDKTSSALWLAQANYIFRQLKIVSNHEDYMLVNCVRFTLKISKTRHDPPDGYLFVCSPTDFETGPTSLRWPNCPAYWSLDPSSGNPLSDEEASRLGFPTITRRTWVRTVFWDGTVYAGLHKFDECKGFDPESQDVARELVYPLYEVCVPASVAMKWNFPVDRDDGSNYSSSYSEEEYSTEDEIESNSYLASSCVEVLTTDDESFLEEFSFDERLTAENEDSLRNFPSHETIVAPYYSIGELAELVKFGLIVVLGLMTLYEYAGITKAHAKPYKTTSSACAGAPAPTLPFGRASVTSSVVALLPLDACRRGTGNVLTPSIQACTGSFGALRQLVNSLIGLDLPPAAHASILRPRGQFLALSPFASFWSPSLLLSLPSLCRSYPPISYSAFDSLEFPLWNRRVSKSGGGSLHWVRTRRTMSLIGQDSMAAQRRCPHESSSLLLFPFFICPLHPPPPTSPLPSAFSSSHSRSLTVTSSASASRRFHVASSPSSAPSYQRQHPVPPFHLHRRALFYCRTSTTVSLHNASPNSPAHLAHPSCPVIAPVVSSIFLGLASWSLIPMIQVTCAAIYLQMILLPGHSRASVASTNPFDTTASTLAVYTNPSRIDNSYFLLSI
ncbi:hypothetical protein MSAN_01103300 [Mycena sanguinolenta]|uniref:Protein kinase domain-containing protein n=1 Tax=Mycena sanguinolenta TaxID=230812 RepID=A0A8H7DA22_9AGAR|nr:hypothetical protein MSAN_01103300 [Mycena sanguinolenta]